MNLGLENRVALVAAASKGLGFGVARALAADGARVSICSRTAEDVEAAGQALRDETGAEVMAMSCDVTDPESINNWVAATVERWGHIDALLVNAGGPPAGFIREISEAQWEAAFQLTLMSSIRMINAALPHMGRGSAILTVTSSSIREPIERLALSTVMRSGVMGLVKTLADELAGDGIRVNNLIPGRIDTDRVRQLDGITASRLGISPEEARDRAMANIPLGRLGSIDDFGAAGAFLLSPAAAYITGASLRVDGGQMRSV
ncbi:MAG: SDR family oxidoreductase [Anaerolineaceae bacterium]|nr:SDR family oxidoreductase [Anaerolineaceae bacterium]MCY3906631.1 SDR family oxidoreductase [Anaerolineaceae bacterium]MDD9956433.1 SDR family oxidoreductase [Anaerolineaceae bacterium]MDE0329654.1 SDR family oxidoreductase [Anaerolineaceae bacterium]MDE0609973.1 SDR family oxidoreductase [Anaerolineaceae bacterium]